MRFCLILNIINVLNISNQVKTVNIKVFYYFSDDVIIKIIKKLN